MRVTKILNSGNSDNEISYFGGIQLIFKEIQKHVISLVEPSQKQTTELFHILNKKRQVCNTMCRKLSVTGMTRTLFKPIF